LAKQMTKTRCDWLKRIFLTVSYTQVLANSINTIKGCYSLEQRALNDL
jgi:hypothetical protein